MKEKLLTTIPFLILMITVGMANNIVMPGNSLPYRIFLNQILYDRANQINQ